MRAKNWVLRFLGITFFIAGIIGGLNYIVDPYGLNDAVKRQGFNFYKLSNTGYTFRFKTNVYKASHYDTLLLGTSRVEVMDPEVVDGILGGKTFNFGSSGSITEIQRDLFFYGVHNQPIKNVIYGIDFLSLNGSIKLEEKFKEFCEAEDRIEHNKAVNNYDLYFNYETLFDSFFVLKSNLMGKKMYHKRYLKNGMRDYINYIKEWETGKYNMNKRIKQSVQSYYSQHRKGGYQNYRLSLEYMQYIKEIVNYCKVNNIRLWVYIPPMYRDHFDALNAYGIYDEFEAFKRELVKVVNYIDFTGHNSVTDDKNYFWDGSHLRREFSGLVMAKVLDDESVEIPNDFGVMVTSENIETHLKNLREGLQPYDLNKTLEGAE